MGLSIVNTLTSEDIAIFFFIDNKTSISNSSSHNGFYLHITFMVRAF
ncbi:hypothetical protein QFZ73_004705 [Peribacillus sp. V2I11]|nr:hypothetical protein [Peribacillus sp. V2I11]